MKKGLIFNIQRYSLHDGPGIRTTIFFKGCPLSCSWCQNPEGIKLSIDLFRYPRKCIACSSCLDNCPQGAISLNGMGPLINRGLCNLCLKCAENCPAEAIKAAGREVTVDYLTGIVLRDRIVYEESGGGVTISGGEPLHQAEFLVNLLKTLKKDHIHTVVETSGHAPWEAVKNVSEWTDLIYYDLKFADNLESIKYTGVPNTLIVDNLRRLTENGSNIKIRIPLIPTINDNPENLHRLAGFLNDLDISEIELLSYHKLGLDKYRSLDLHCSVSDIEAPTNKELDQAISELEKYAINVYSEV